MSQFQRCIGLTRVRRLWRSGLIVGVVRCVAIAAACMFIAAGGTLPSASDAATNVTPTFFAEVSTGIARITTYGCGGRPLGQGTGFLVGESVVMTARHVVLNACKVRVQVGGGTFVGERWFNWSGGGTSQRAADLATIKLSRAVAGAYVFRIGSGSPPVGTNLGMAGYPLGNDLSFNQGPILGRKNTGGAPLLAVRMLGAEGASGAPFFDDSGRVVGILQIGLGSKDVLGQRTAGVLVGLDLVRWWGANARIDLCRAYPNGGVTGCQVTTKPQPTCGIGGNTWTARSTPLAQGVFELNWQSVTYGNGLFVAVTNTFQNRVMTSPDGITWTSRAAPINHWVSVTYGNGLFVAVSERDDGNQVMTSPDGITWTSRTTPVKASWTTVTYGAGLFVALAASNDTDRVMTSPDGITWTSRKTIANDSNNLWRSVTYGGGLFVAVADSSVMTSPDGITWTNRTTPKNSWNSVTFGNGRFVAVANGGTGNRAMTSRNGITWASSTTPNNTWASVTFGRSIFVAVAYGLGANLAMTSPDGITWTSRKTTASNNVWRSVTYGNGLFVAVASNKTNRVMTCGTVAG